jgi:predicted Ser/Thr protein kinase
MAELQEQCPSCGAPLPEDAPEGLCPECVLRHEVETIPPPADDGGRPAPFRGFIAPEPAELAARFPELEILEMLGQGGMGAVYKARQPNLDRLVALKILPQEAASDPAFTERFTREARAMAKLHHPNIVTVYESGHKGGLYYLLMEFVDGVNLRQLLRAGRLQPAEALKIIPQICEALQYAHEEGIVHRDIKPENVLLDKKGRVKITDFGIAKLLGRPTGTHTITGPWQVVGTPNYMAPEQMDKPLTVDHRADIYSLGVVFYEMLTGELPRGRFAPPSQKVQVDVRLDEVVLRALEVEPERRYQHASDVKTDVENISANKPRAAAAPLAAAAHGEKRSDDWLPKLGSWSKLTPALDLDRCFREAIAVYKKNLLILVLAAFLFHVLSLFSVFVLCGPLLGGICLMTIRAMRREDKRVDLGDLFGMFGRFWPFVGIFFLTAPAVCLGFVFCLAPGFALAALWLFSFYLMVDADVGVFRGLRASQTIVARKGFGPNLLLFVIAAALELGPKLVPGVGLLIGWFVTPLAWLMVTSAYIQQVHEDDGTLRDLFETVIRPAIEKSNRNPQEVGRKA